MYKEIFQTARSAGPPCSNLSQLLPPGERYRTSDVCRSNSQRVLRIRKMYVYVGGIVHLLRNTVGDGFQSSERTSVRAVSLSERFSWVGKRARLGFGLRKGGGFKHPHNTYEQERVDQNDWIQLSIVGVSIRPYDSDDFSHHGYPIGPGY